jgi:iron complex outermembrane receptor protein
MKTLLLLLFIPTLLMAQTATLRGTVLDVQHRSVAFASVVLPMQQQGTTANANGEFELKSLRPGPARVSASAVGYERTEQDIMLEADRTVELKLTLLATAALKEVIVTGVSRATELRRSAVPVVALGKREINLNATANIIDAAVKGVPGLDAVTTGPNISKPFIRGLGYNRVLTLYNGLRQEGQQWGDEHGLEVDQYDIERVEVVKGPASLIYGSDAVAGVINLLPRLPQGPAGQLKGEALSEYQTNNNLLGNSLALNYNQNGWQLAGRTSARMARAYRNAVDGRVFGTAFRELNATALVGREGAWGSSHLSATLYDNRQEIPDGSRDSLSRRFTRQVFDGSLDDVRNRPVVSDNDLNTYRINPLSQRIQHYRLLSRNRLRLGTGELHALLGVQRNVRREFTHPSAPEQAALYLQLTTLNYDLRYAAPAWHGLETTVGVNGMRQLNRSGDATDFAIPDYQLFDLGGYVHLKKTFGKLDLSGGVRYDSRWLSWDDFYTGTDPATGFGRQLRAAEASGVAPQFAAFSRRYRGVSASAGASYSFSDRLVLRANLARGYRAPNITEVGSNGLDPGAHIVYLGNRSFNPEFSLQQDLGLSAYLPDAELSVSAFNNQIANYIYQARLFGPDGAPLVIVPGNVTYQYQQARARLYGAEATAQLHPRALPGLSLNTSLAYVTGLNQNPQLLDAHGEKARYLPFIPPLHTRAELRYTLSRTTAPLANSYLRAVADSYTAQNRFYAVDDTETATAGYTLIGFGAGTTLVSGADKRERLQLFMQLDNAFNVSYQSHLNRLKYFEYYQASPTGRRGIYNQGRNLSVKLVLPF